MIPPEIELIAVPVQVLPADAVERAVNSALEQSEIGLCGVGVGVSANIFLPAVVDDLVAAPELSSDPLVGQKLVGIDRRGPIDVLPNRAFEILGVHAVDGVALNPAITLHHSHDRGFPFGSPAGHALSRFSAHVGLVDLHFPLQKRLKLLFPHGMTDSMRHMPRTFVRNPHHPV